jgi:hypothetical protein
LLIDDPYYLLNKGERQKLNGFLRELKRNVNLLIASADDDLIIGFAPALSACRMLACLTGIWWLKNCAKLRKKDKDNGNSPYLA